MGKKPCDQQSTTLAFPTSTTRGDSDSRDADGRPTAAQGRAALPPVSQPLTWHRGDQKGRFPTLSTWEGGAGKQKPKPSFLFVSANLRSAVPELPGRDIVLGLGSGRSHRRPLGDVLVGCSSLPRTRFPKASFLCGSDSRSRPSLFPKPHTLSGLQGLSPVFPFLSLWLGGGNRDCILLVLARVTVRINPLVLQTGHTASWGSP